MTDVQNQTGLFAAADPEYIACLSFFSVLVVLYTTFGGFRAVVWTDVLQGFIMLGSIVVLLFLTIHQAGGLSAATAQVAKQVPPRLGEVQFSVKQPATQSIRISTDTWFELFDKSTGQRRLFRTNEGVVIPAGVSPISASEDS